MTEPQSAEAVRAGDARACGPGADKAAFAARAADLFMNWLAYEGVFLATDEQCEQLAKAFIGGYLTGRPEIRMPWEPA